ncbi:MAG: putative peptide-modifying radical SAM/SPASM domain-containing protein, partial [Methanospirillum sp.]|nr:putative peptide-modifying radical SAM/SPASM domain-containing protein [Methanospirillum sp.]
KGRCRTCDIRDFCGGRCLYSSILEPWPKEGADLVCETVRALKTALENILPDIQHLVEKKIITTKHFAHEKFNGCEIIP